MDKVKINNQIVLMRKYVKQAKIHVISKYVKQAKLFQNRKGGAENQIEKCKRKAERLLSEIAILKKIQTDSVSKMALSKAKDWKTVLAQKNVSLDDRCFAMLANFDSVQKEVDKFYTTNQELVPKLATLIASIGSTTKRLKQNKGKPIKKLNNTAQAYKTNESMKERKVHAEKIEQNPSSSKSEESEDVEVKKKKLVDNLNFPETDGESESEGDRKEGEIDNSISHQNINAEKILNTENSIEDDSEKFKAHSNFKVHSKINSVKKVASQRSESEVRNAIDKQSLKKRKISPGVKNIRSPGVKNIKSPGVKNIKKSTLQSCSESSDIDQDPGLETDEYEGSETSPSRVKDEVEVNFRKSWSPKHVKRDTSTTDLHVEEKETQKTNMDKISLAAFKNLDIQSRLAAIANNTYPRPDVAAKKKSQSKMKAIAVLNLNELQDLDEISLGNSNATTEVASKSKDSFLDMDGDEASSENESSDEESGQPSVHKKDPFFLTNDGQVVSESGESDAEPSYGKKQLGRKDFNNEFSNRKFAGDSYPGKRPSFGKNNFQRDTGNNFQKDKRHNFKGDKSHDFQGDKRYNFKDKGNSFKRDRHYDSDLNKNKKFKPMGRGRFDDKSNLKKHGKGDFATRNFGEKSDSNQYKKAISQMPQMKTFQKGKTDDKPLHPSWEAKRKMKEAGKTKFQGKRMVFTD